MDLINRQMIYDKIVKRYPDRNTDQYAVGYADAINDVLKDIRYESSAELYTDEEIQRMSDLEQAELNKAYELGKESIRKTGKWIPLGDVDSDNNQLYECNQCHHCDLHAVNVDVPYCWYCGAKMEGGNK